MKGVTQFVSGYVGGTVVHPSYQDVCTGTTGHVEAVQITYNSNEISYHDILEVFFTIHDPTTVNRQGADVGPQYRSIIFYHNEEQKRIATHVILELEAKHNMTQVLLLNLFP